MKKVIGIICLVCVLCLSGCTVEMGDSHYEITDARDVFDIFMGEVDIPNGGTKEDLTSFVTGNVDSLFGSVSLPKGTNREKLKEFVTSNLNELGIDLEKIDYSNKEDVEALEKSIKEGLEEQGLDGSDIHISISAEKE